MTIEGSETKGILSKRATRRLPITLSYFSRRNRTKILICICNHNITYDMSRMMPDRGLSNRKQSGVKAKKNRLTYVFTSNANRSEKLLPFIIGKAVQP